MFVNERKAYKLIQQFFIDKFDNSLLGEFPVLKHESGLHNISFKSFYNGVAHIKYVFDKLFCIH